MVDGITSYSQLQRMAAANGENDIKAYAQKIGMSEEEFAKLQQLGGVMEEPGDHAKFSHKKVSVNDVTGLLSLYGVNDSDGSINLSREAKKQLGEFGVVGLVMKDGALYAQHKDGNDYVITNISDYDLAAVEEYSANKGLMSSSLKAITGLAGAILGVATPVPAVLSTIGAIALASCSKADEVTEYNFTNNNNNTINLNVKLLDTLQNILNKMLAKQTSSDDTLKALLNEVKSLKNDVNANSEQVKALLQSILAAIGNNTDLLNIVVDGIGQNNDLIQVVIDKLTEGNKTLADIKDLIVKNHESDAAYQQKALQLLADIKTALSKLNTDMNANYNNILKAITKQGASLATIEALLRTINANVEKINALVTKYGDEGTNIGKAILNAIGNLNFNTNVDLGSVESLLKRILDGQGITHNKLDNMTDIINKLGFDMVTNFDAILKAIQNKGDTGKGIEALLEQVLANQATMIKDNKDGFKAVIDAIKGICVGSGGGAVDLSSIEDLLKKILSGVNDNGSLLKHITEQNDTVIMILKSFKKEVGDKLEGFDAWFEAIYNKIQPGGTGGCSLDFNALMAKLDEILNAIKDHDVHVTVDITGEVTCNCGCTDGNGNKHEGIIGNLNDLLG